jgi:hypothetical protein
MRYFFSLIFFSSIVLIHGQAYWQQEVNYKISVKLDDKNHFLSGFEEFEYINNSPNTLDKIYVHLWANAYKNGKTALAKQLYENGETDLKFGADSIKGFIDSLNFKSNNETLKWELDKEHIDIALIYLPQPLKSGEKITISTPFRVKLPSGSISRLGHIGQSYQITQWYPKPAVYDKNGWNQMPYLNQGEFYSEYGSYDVSITLPKNYIVGATGDLQNEEELTFLNKIAKETENNIDSYPEKGNKQMEFPASDKELKTIRYTQSKVHDFAWFADKRYLVLKGEVALPHSKRKVTSWAMFTPQNAKLWKKGIEYINDGTYYYSLWNGDYPYNQVTAVDGTISAGGGMEYPNVTVIGSVNTAQSLETVIVHEVGHNWFYGILGSNERVHGWMDEGINTLNEVRYMQTKYPNNSITTDQIAGRMIHMDNLDYKAQGEYLYKILAHFGGDQPIETHSAEFTSTNYGLIMYQKTGLVFYYLKDYLGDSLFNTCFQAYFEDWKFKHPQPEDMQKTLERVSGKNLSWLFDDLIKTTKLVDYKIQCIHHSKNGGSTVKVKNVGQVEGPIEVNIYQGDTIIETAWVEPGQRSIDIKTPKKSITKAAIDANRDIPEINRQNNYWYGKQLLSKIDEPKFEFLLGDQDNFKNNFFYTPILAGNSNDKFMFGLAVHNVAIPLKKTQFLLAPMFSLENKSLAGIAEFTHSFYPQKYCKTLALGASVKRFKTDSEFVQWQSGLNFGSIYLQSNLGNPNKKSKLNHVAKIALAVRNETRGTNSLFLGGGYAWYEASYRNPDNRFKLQVRFDEMHELESNSDQLRRISLTTEYGYRYLKNSMKRWIYLRGFFGNNLNYTNGSGIGNQYYQMALSGADGRQDLFMEEYYFERFNPNSQMRNNNFGGFNSTSAFGTTSFWMATGNVYAPLPIPRLGFIGLFADGGAFYDGNAINYAYNAGLGVRLGSVVGIYVPFLRSSIMSNPFENFGNNIRLTLKFNPFNRPINVSSLGL